jgi:hypothetical protein
MSAKRKSVRAALATTYAGPIAIALLLAGGIDGFVIAVRDPVTALLCTGLNLLLRQAPTVSIRLQGPTPSAFLFVFGAVLAVLVFACGLWLGTWLYPNLSPPKSPTPN